jgi:uncharacterized protein with GYD domain
VAENRKPEVITRKPYESLKRIRWYRHYPDCLTRAMRVAYPGMVMRLAFQPESAGLVYGGKNAMATYVHLFNFTEQGLRNIKDTVKRAEALKKAASEVGANLKEIIWTQGQYDIVAIFEAPDEATANSFFLNVLKAGNLRSQTLRGFTAAEMEKILEKVA